VLDRAARLLEDIGGSLGELAATAERWREDLGSVVQAAETTRVAGERMAELPRGNLEHATETGRVLADAATAARRSANEAAAVADEARHQRAALDDLTGSARDLAATVERLAHTVRFLSTDHDEA
jgi:ABC-type transporter Mla subunit MlaD